MVKIHYHDDHKYFNPLIHRMEGCIEYQEGYYADEAACVEYSPETGILLVNDSPVEMSNAVSIFFCKLPQTIHEQTTTRNTTTTQNTLSHNA